MLDLKWLNDCMQAGEFLYGAYPLAVLKKLYETMKGYTVAKRELAEQCEAAEGQLMTYVDAVFPEFEALGYQEPGYFMPLVVREGQLYDVLRQAEKDGIPYAGLHLDEEAVWELLGEQGDVEFAIPTADEIAANVKENL